MSNITTTVTQFRILCMERIGASDERGEGTEATGGEGTEGAVVSDMRGSAENESGRAETML
jgi:hypothetical protein